MWTLEGGINTAAWLPVEPLACLSRVLQWAGLVVDSPPRSGPGLLPTITTPASSAVNWPSVLSGVEDSDGE